MSDGPVRAGSRNYRTAILCSQYEHSSDGQGRPSSTCPQGKFTLGPLIRTFNKTCKKIDSHSLAWTAYRAARQPWEHAEDWGESDLQFDCLAVRKVGDAQFRDAGPVPQPTDHQAIISHRLGKGPWDEASGRVLVALVLHLNLSSRAQAHPRAHPCMPCQTATKCLANPAADPDPQTLRPSGRTL